MRRYMLSAIVLLGLLSFAPKGHAQTAQYVKVCDLFGAGFHYIPGTDSCMNDETGDTRTETPGGTWRTILPYPSGKWVTDVDEDCKGKLFHVGSFKSTDFTLNIYDRSETHPFSLRLSQGSFISKVIMSGGFYAPPVAPQHGTFSSQGLADGLCIRSKDPYVIEHTDNGYQNPPYGNDSLPIGCISNSKIVGMPAAYSIAAESAYPEIDITTFTDGALVKSKSYQYGSELVVTTDFINTISIDPATGNLIYKDPNSGSTFPLAGTLSVNVCVEQGSPEQRGNWF
jgi:hypothetical protein